MESPPSTSTWSDPFILSDDSGLLLTGSSVSSGSMSGESHTFSRFVTDLQDSDCEDKSFSQADSLDGMSDVMCGENYNTLKKGPHWLDSSDCKINTPIEPPLEFQDKPNVVLYESLANSLIPTILNEAIRIYCRTVAHCMDLLPMHNIGNRQVLTSSYWSSDFLPFTSPPSSRRSLVSSRFSSSHNSLSVPAAHKVDDSSFITQAVSHDALVSTQISDIYNVPFDSDMYAVPVDVVRQQCKPRRVQQYKKRRRNTSSCCRELDDHPKQIHHNSVRKYCVDYIKCKRLTTDNKESVVKRHSVAGSSAHVEGEPVHMTLQEVRHYLQTLYSSSSDSSVHKDYESKTNTLLANNNNNNKYAAENNNLILTSNNSSNNKNSQKFKKNTFLINLKNKRIKDTCEPISEEQILVTKPSKSKKSFARMSSFKQTLCNIFRFKRFLSPERKEKVETNYNKEISMTDKENHRPPTRRALPPLPSKKEGEEIGLDFTTSIQKVKDYGWYWGPLSSEAAEKVLSNEPDGSFIVRDSSDDHYIFSLTFKLNNSIRHVRIEHDQGNFSFGSCTKFKSQTIVEFIENAVEHSRSGRYLFFLHRRPVIGPVRVQLLHPVSRFKQIQSLQHMCRFVILKLVRRDLLLDLPLPRRMLDYLNTPHYYTENVCDIDEQSDGSNLLLDTTTVPQSIYTNNNAVIINEPVSNVGSNRVYENSSSTFRNNSRQS